MELFVFFIGNLVNAYAGFGEIVIIVFDRFLYASGHIKFNLLPVKKLD